MNKPAIMIVALAALLLAACGSPQPTPTPFQPAGPTATPIPPLEDLIAQLSNDLAPDYLTLLDKVEGREGEVRYVTDDWTVPVSGTLHTMRDPDKVPGGTYLWERPDGGVVLYRAPEVEGEGGLLVVWEPEEAE